MQEKESKEIQGQFRELDKFQKELDKKSEEAAAKQNLILQTNQDGDTVTISDGARMQRNGAQNSSAGNSVEGFSGSSATSEPPGAPDTFNQGE